MAFGLASAPSLALAQLVPPKVIENATPIYPESKKATAESATVHLSLTLDAAGKVTKVEVAQSSGSPEFDAAAIEAAGHLVFEPASKDGKPVPAKIPFRFEFAYTPPPPPPPEKKNDALPVKKGGLLEGEVQTSVNQPLAGARVVVTSNGQPVATLTTDEKGAFTSPRLPKGHYHVELSAEGFTPYAIDEDVDDNAATHVVYRLDFVASDIDIVVKGDRPPREVTKRTLEQEEIIKGAGTNGDALRSLENMPGVARPPAFAGLLIVRGSAPTDTLIFVDGTEIPIAYHFGGLSSVIPSEMLERIDFYPGNFGPEYGRVMGGIVDVGIRSPNREKYHGLVQFDLIDMRALVEGPITKSTRFLVAGRRSWLDAWLPAVLKKAGADVTAAPVYYDWQAVLEHDLTSKTTARLLFMGDDDRLKIVFSSPADFDPALGGDIGNRTKFWRLQARFDTKLSDDVRILNTLSYGHDGIFFNFGDRFLDVDLRPWAARSDLRAKLTKEATLIGGLDLVFTPYDVSYKFPPFPQDGVIVGPTFARPANLLFGSGKLVRPGAYLMLDLSPGRGVKLLPGLRADYSGDTSSWTVDPRLAARIDLSPGYPRTTLKGGLGMFHQPPQPNESLEPFGNKGLTSNRAIHYSIGVEQELTRNVEISIELFTKSLSNLVSQEFSSSSANGVHYVNKGIGKIYGGETLLRWKPDGRFFGWLAYTLSRSERRDFPNQDWHIFTYDQTHILTALGSYKLGRGWELGARFRYVTGNPDTAFHGGLVDYDAGAYDPIQGPKYGTRVAAYHTLDIRIEKAWVFSSWKLSAYLDLHNAYNRKNAEGTTYNYDYTQSKPLSGLPILPILGVRGEL